ESARIAVGIGIVLGEGLELADIDLADERGDVLIVLVAGLSLGDGDLPQARRLNARNPEARDVAAEGLEPLQAPGTHEAVEAPARDAVALLEDRSHRLRIEQAERAFEYGAQLVVGFQHVDRVDLHERLEPLRQRRLAAADRSQQVENLLALLEPLCGVT